MSSRTTATLHRQQADKQDHARLATVHRHSGPGLLWLQRTLGNQAFGWLVRQAAPITAPCACSGHRRKSACSCPDKQTTKEVGRAGSAPHGSRTATAAAVLARAGTPLPPVSRARFERAFGTDLSHVRLHTDDLAAQASDHLNAQAWTSGHHVVLGAGHFAPGTPAGDRLLAHELTHALQQRGAVPRAVFTGDDQDAEAQAEQIADQVTSNNRPSGFTPRPAGIARQLRRGGVTQIDLDCAARTIHFNGPQAHTWTLSECDLSDGDYEATVELQRTPTTVVRFRLRNAPPGTRFRFSYRVMGSEVDPYDLVRDGQPVRIRATSAPTSTTSGQVADPGLTTFHVAVLNAATYEAATGQSAAHLPDGQLHSSSFRFAVPGTGFGMLSTPPYVPTAIDPWAGTFSERWAGGGAATSEAAARANTVRTGRFVPSWALDPATQNAWRGIRMADLSPTEMLLLEDILNAPSVLLGRSINVRNQESLVLDDWLAARGIRWTQRWQDVYNRALYARTSTGIPVDVLAGAGYTLGEVTAAEAGARASGITNRPFWWEGTPRPREVSALLSSLPPPTGLRARLGLANMPTGELVRDVLRVGGLVLLVYGVYSSATRIADAPEGQRAVVAAEEGGSWLGGWVGSVMGSAIGSAVICSTTGPGALICAGSFAIVGGLTGSLTGAGLANDLAAGAEKVGDLLRDPARFNEATMQMFGNESQRRRYYQNRDLLESIGF